MTRFTVADVLASRLPAAVGKCSTDVAGVCAIINSATMRLLWAVETGDSSWWGCWSELAYNLTQANPYFVLPRGYSGVIGIDVCSYPIALHNAQWEFLRFGFGKLPKSTSCAPNRCAPLEALDRGTVPTQLPGVVPNNKLRVYLSDSGDVGKRVLLQYNDANGIPIRTLDGVVEVLGEFVTLTAPFVDASSEYSLVTGVQKDPTLANVSIYTVDMTTGDQSLISTMEPSETIGDYRKFFVSGLPKNCCNVPVVTAGTTQVQVLAKRDFVPVSVVTDYLVIGNIEALTREAQAIRYSEMDSSNAKQMEANEHRMAVRLLQGQLVANEGKLNPAISFKPFLGSPFVTLGAG